MRERRKHERQSQKEYIAVYDRESGDLFGELANLSSEGAMIVTKGPVKTQNTYFCRIGLSRPMSGRNEIIFDAECLWCRKNLKSGAWESGYRLSMSALDSMLIQYLSLSFKLGHWGDANLPGTQVVELENRRRSGRYELDEAIPVFEHGSYRQIGQVADLSAQGVRLISDRPISRGDTLHCRALLPKRIFQQEYLHFDAQCMWSREKENGQFESGNRITLISELDSAIILHLIIHNASFLPTKKRLKVVH